MVSMNNVIQFIPKKQNIYFFNQEGKVLTGKMVEENARYAKIKAKSIVHTIPKGFYFLGLEAMISHLKQHGEFHAKLIIELQKG